MSPRAIYKYLTPHHSRILTINAMEFIQIFYINISNHKGLFIHAKLIYLQIFCVISRLYLLEIGVVDLKQDALLLLVIQMTG